MELERFVSDFAAATKAIDATRPVAKSAHGDKSYPAGIGPHTETWTVELVMSHLAVEAPERYAASMTTRPTRWPNSPGSRSWETNGKQSAPKNLRNRS